MRDEESRLSSDTLHWYSACVTHHRQPIVTACSVRSHVTIEAEKWLTGSLRRNQRLIYGRLLLGSWGVRVRSVWVLERREIRWTFTALLLYKILMIQKKNHGCFPAGDPQGWTGAATLSDTLDPPCVVNRAERFSCAEGVEVHQSAVFCLCETSSSVSYEEKPPLWAFRVPSGRGDPFWVLFPKLIQLGFINKKRGWGFCNHDSGKWQNSTICSSPHRRAPTAQANGAIRRGSAAAQRSLQCWAAEGSRCCRWVLADQKRPNRSPVSTSDSVRSSTGYAGPPTEDCVAWNHSIMM